jgi:hypothetical protein
MSATGTATARVRVKEKDEVKSLLFSIKSVTEDLAPFEHIEKLAEMKKDLIHLAEICANVIKGRSTRNGQ